MENCRQDLHRLAVATLIENLRCHVSRRSTCGCQHVELLLIHNPRQAKVCNQEIRIVFWCAEQQILGLEVTVHNAMVVQIRNSGEDGTNQTCGVSLVVAAFAADAIEKLSTESKVSD